MDNEMSKASDAVDTLERRIFMKGKHSPSRPFYPLASAMVHGECLLFLHFNRSGGIPLSPDPNTPISRANIPLLI